LGKKMSSKTVVGYSEYHLQAGAMRKVLLLVVLCVWFFSWVCFGLGQEKYVDTAGGGNDFVLAQKGRLAVLYVASEDWPGVVRAVNDLQADVNRVTGQSPKITNDENDLAKNTVIIGTIGKSRLINRLIAQGKVDVNEVAGKWESFVIQGVVDPLRGVDKALVIAGSDKRGTIYGVYDVSEQIGVSPWYWWADVPVEHKDNLFVKAGRYVQGPPAVKYRGIFLNDEWPSLGGWTAEKFGGFNHKFYVKVFELLLRLKANYLWPAMWTGCFNEDDPNNPRLADEYGIVMGTSHHEPMMRAWKEWSKRGHGKGSWDYSKDEEVIREYWLEGLKRTRNYEEIITIGMRGDGDEPMSESDNILLLEKIVADQRKMIAEVINPDVTKVPQDWALYKEVQGYYRKGMRVPDDVTLLWCDDNWGDVRRLPTAKERKRSGGAGVYYHFDYVGGPRSYRWINTNPLPKIWEQMNLAYHYDADRIWIVNVGDLKPMEFPIEFFLNLAWDPARWPKEKISQFALAWAAREFGPEYAADIADIVSKYAKYDGRRKPELVGPTTYSLTNYREAQRVSAEFKEITDKAERIYADLPDNARDAFFELVLYPTKASAIVNELYITVGKNHLYAKQGRASTNDLAKRAAALFAADAELSKYYNTELAKGKWNHMMDQTHIGYTSWDNPPKNIMPAVKELDLRAAADMGVAVEGSEGAWPGSAGEPALEQFDVFNQQNRYIDVFNRGLEPFEFTATASEPWIVPSETKGTVDKEMRLSVSIDWNEVSTGKVNGTIEIVGAGGKKVDVQITAFKPQEPARDSLEGFIEGDGYVSMEAEHCTKKVDAALVRWEEIPDYGRTLSGMTIFPVTAESVTPPQDSPHLEYKMYLFNPGKVEVESIVAPTLNFVPGRGLRYAVSFDDEQPQVVDIVPASYNAGDGNRDWEDSVRNSARVVKSTHTISQAGYHTLKIWMVDPAVVLTKIIVNTGGLKRSYLGPPESFRGQSVSSKAVSSEAASGQSCRSDSGAFVSGKYRDLFVEAGHSPNEVQAKVNKAFEQLFEGDPCTQALYFPAGSNANGPLAYICDIHNDDVRSEGMSYGMMIAVQLDRKKQFDALWNWARTYMYHDAAGHPARGFFSWSVKTDGVPNDEMPAPDGEEYFAMSLYFAAGRWGNGEGIYNYRAEADKLLSDMKNRKVITGMTVLGERTAGNLFDAEHRMVRFTPDVNNWDFTDPSYQLPAFYELWALWGPKADRPFWAQAASASREFFVRATNPVTGLAPEYANFDGTPRSCYWNEHSVDFQYDAWRTAMNWSMDWAWWHKDPREQLLSDKRQAFFESQGMSTYGNRFTLDGKQFGDDHSTGLVATNAAASLAATNPRAQKFVEALWNTPIPSGQYRYYDGMLYLLSMLHCSGDFRIWPVQ
jgi:endo-1,4-beta-D-glucanase Y